MSRVVRSPESPPQRIGILALLALGMSLAAAVPEAMSAPAPPGELWSIQLHSGLFAPIEGTGASPTVGMRYGRHYNPHLQVGLLSAWTYTRRSLEQPGQDPPNVGPGVELARIDAQLVPLMGFLQVNLTDRFLVPFAGIAGGYEWMILDALDHRTGIRTHSIYKNWAWEAYGGLGLRLNSKVRVNGELFYNGGSLERDVLDDNGKTWLEAIHVNGVGARFGLDMVFE